MSAVPPPSGTVETLVSRYRRGQRSFKKRPFKKEEEAFADRGAVETAGEAVVGLLRNGLQSNQVSHSVVALERELDRSWSRYNNAAAALFKREKRTSGYNTAHQWVNRRLIQLTDKVRAAHNIPPGTKDSHPKLSRHNQVVHMDLLPQQVIVHHFPSLVSGEHVKSDGVECRQHVGEGRIVRRCNIHAFACLVLELLAYFMDSFQEPGFWKHNQDNTRRTGGAFHQADPARQHTAAVIEYLLCRMDVLLRDPVYEFNTAMLNSLLAAVKAGQHITSLPHRMGTMQSSLRAAGMHDVGALSVVKTASRAQYGLSMTTSPTDEDCVFPSTISTVRQGGMSMQIDSSKLSQFRDYVTITWVAQEVMVTLQQDEIDTSRLNRLLRNHYKSVSKVSVCWTDTTGKSRKTKLHAVVSHLTNELVRPEASNVETSPGFSDERDKRQAILQILIGMVRLATSRQESPGLHARLLDTDSMIAERLARKTGLIPSSPERGLDLSQSISLPNLDASYGEPDSVTDTSQLIRLRSTISYLPRVRSTIPMSSPQKIITQSSPNDDRIPSVQPKASQGVLAKIDSSLNSKTTFSQLPDVSYSSRRTGEMSQNVISQTRWAARAPSALQNLLRLWQRTSAYMENRLARLVRPSVKQATNASNGSV